MQSGLTITTAPELPPGVPGVAYSAALSAVGGATPYVWSVTAGAIPNGLRLDASTGALSGTPATPGNYTFTVTVKDAANTSAQKVFTLVVAPGVTFTTPAALPDATAGTPYSFTLQAAGGQAPYSWRIADGVLPDGLALNATTGTIAGTPQAPGTFNFTIEVTDAFNLKASRVHTIVATLPGVPTLNITGIPTNLAPLQQPSIDVAVSAPYPVAITGRLILSFTPASRDAGRSFRAVLVGRPLGGVHDCGECYACDLRRAAVRATVGERRREHSGHGGFAGRRVGVAAGNGHAGAYGTGSARSVHQERIRHADDGRLYGPNRRSEHQPRVDRSDRALPAGGGRHATHYGNDGSADRSSQGMVPERGIDRIRWAVHIVAAILDRGWDSAARFGGGDVDQFGGVVAGRSRLRTSGIQRC